MRLLLAKEKSRTRFFIERFLSMHPRSATNLNFDENYIKPLLAAHCVLRERQRRKLLSYSSSGPFSLSLSRLPFLHPRIQIRRPSASVRCMLHESLSRSHCTRSQHGNQEFRGVIIKSPECITMLHNTRDSRTQAINLYNVFVRPARLPNQWFCLYCDKGRGKATEGNRPPLAKMSILCFVPASSPCCSSCGGGGLDDVEPRGTKRDCERCTCATASRRRRHSPLS